MEDIKIDPNQTLDMYAKHLKFLKSAMGDIKSNSTLTTTTTTKLKLRTQ